MGKSNHNYTYAEAQLIARFKASFGGVAACALCGEPIRFDAPKYHRLSFSADHVVPLDEGGPHTIENLRPAHFG